MTQLPGAEGARRQRPRGERAGASCSGDLHLSFLPLVLSGFQPASPPLPSPQLTHWDAALTELGDRS